MSPAGGMIYTFYSYKGGVGRSMTLANLGALFFRQGYTTLMIDWDLEAPGLERYLEERYPAPLQQAAALPGVTDLIADYKARVSEPADEEDEGLPVPDLGNYLVELDSRGESRLLFLGAGCRSEGTAWREYARFVQDFDWSDFYRDWEGGSFFEWLRIELKATADVVLIDSRTGVTEMGGVTTQHLADVVVLLCGSNLENVISTARMARNFANEAVREARSGRVLDVIVVPSRIDDADQNGFGLYLTLLEKEFDWLNKEFLGEISPPDKLIIHYVPAFSYRETLIIGDTEAERLAGRLVEEYWNVHKEMRSLAHEETALRLGWPRALEKTQDPVVYLTYGRDGTQHARHLAGHLCAHGIDVRHADQANRVSEHDVAVDMERAHVVVAIVTRGMVRSKVLSHTLLIAEDLGKPIIPVQIEEAKVPLALSALRPVDMRMGIAHRVSTLVRAIRVLGHFDPDPVLAADSLIYLCYDGRDSLEDGQRVTRFLNKNGYTTWKASEELLPGMLDDVQMERALGRSRALVALITPRLVKDTRFLMEISFATSIETRILPILVQETPRIPHLLANLESIDGRSNLNDAFRLLLRRLREFAEGL